MTKGENKTCFIIMPITVPEVLLNVYGNDPHHFEMVLENLFLPAISNAGLMPILPRAEGEENIEARIIKSLETADWVLCDMSTFNANVFFEFGVRTALNRPVCVVKDDTTQESPFDTRSINCHTYLSRPQWQVAREVDRLTTHIQKAAETNDGTNSLWRYFGVSSSAVPVEAGEIGEQIQFMREEIRAMRSELKNRPAPDRISDKTPVTAPPPVSHFFEVLQHYVEGHDFQWAFEPCGDLRLCISGPYDIEIAERIKQLARKSGIKGILEIGGSVFAL